MAPCFPPQVRAQLAASFDIPLPNVSPDEEQDAPMIEVLKGEAVADFLESLRMLDMAPGRGLLEAAASFLAAQTGHSLSAHAGALASFASSAFWPGG